MRKGFGRLVTAVLVLTAARAACVSVGGSGGPMAGMLLSQPVSGEEWPCAAFCGSMAETDALGEEGCAYASENGETCVYASGNEETCAYDSENGKGYAHTSENGETCADPSENAQDFASLIGNESASGDSWWDEGGGTMPGSSGQAEEEEAWPEGFSASTGESQVGANSPESAGAGLSSAGAPPAAGLPAGSPAGAPPAAGLPGDSPAGAPPAAGLPGDSPAGAPPADFPAADGFTAEGLAAGDLMVGDPPAGGDSLAAISDDALPDVCVVMRGGMQDDRGNWYYRADNCALEVILSPKNTEESREQAFSDSNIAFRLYLDGTDYTDMADAEEDAAGRIHYRMEAEPVGRICGQDGVHTVRAEAVGYGMLKIGGNKKQADGSLPCEGVRVRKGEAIFILDRRPPEFTVDIEAKKAEHNKPRRQGDRYYFNSSFRIRFTFYDENLEDELVYVRRGEISSGPYDSEREEILACDRLIPCRDGTASERVEAEGIYRYMAGGCDKAGNPLVPAEGAEADGEGRTRHIVVDRTKPSGTLTLTAGAFDVFCMDSAGSILADAPLPAAGEYGAVLCCSGEEEHAPVRFACSYRPDASPAGKARQEDSAAFVRGLPWYVKMPGGGGFTLESWTLEDLAGNRTLVSLKRHFEPARQTGSTSGGGGSGTGSAGSGTASGGRMYGGSSVGGSASYGGTSVGSGSAGGSSSGRTSAGSGSAGGSSAGWTSPGSGGTGSRQTGTSQTGTSQTGTSQAGSSQAGTSQAGPSQTGSSLTDSGRENPRGLTDFKEKRRVISISIRWNGSDKETSCKYTFSTEDVGTEAELVLGEAETAGEEEGGGESGDEPDDAGISLAGESLADLISYAKDGRERTASSGGGRARTPTIRTARLVIDGADFDPSRIIKGGELLYLPEEGEWESGLDEEGNTIWGLPLTFRREGSYHVNVIRAKPVSGTIETLQSLDFLVAEEGAEGAAGAGSIPGGSGAEGAEGAGSGPGGSGAEGAEGAEGPGARGPEGAEDAAGADGADRTDRQGSSGSGRAAIEITFDQEEECRKGVQGPIRPSFTVKAEEAVLVQALEVNGKEQPYERIGNQLTLSEPLKEEGLYELTLSVTDLSGKAAVLGPVEIRIDNTPPRLEVTGIGERPETFYKKAEFFVGGDLEEADFCELTLDGEELDPAALQSEDGRLRIVTETEGRHSFMAQLQDEAGNASARCVRTYTVTAGPLGLIRTRPAIPGGIAAALVCLLCVIGIRRKEQEGKGEEEKPVSPWRAAHSRDLEQTGQGP